LGPHASCHGGDRVFGRVVGQKRAGVVRHIAYGVLGGVGAWLGARFGWPWIGPVLIEPCPIATPFGCVLLTLVGLVYGIGLSCHYAELAAEHEHDHVRRIRRRGTS
jgi:hypothetical protein